DLGAGLGRQHVAGRVVTAEILKLDKGTLVAALRKFVRMYRPHEAREDTELFPAFRELVGARAYARLGEQFEEQEHKLLGEDGFEKAVAEVTQLEEALGIHDLAAFTAR